MKFDRISIFKAFNVSIIIFSLICGTAISISSKKYMDKNVFFISPIINEDKRYFSINDIKQLKDDDVPSINSYESLGDALVCLDKIEIHSKTFNTNSEYFSINNMQFIDGSPWTKGMEKDRAIVINESLAWQLFGNIRVSGLDISILNKKYTITGVVKQGKISKDICSAWYPLYPQNEDDKIINSAFVKISKYNPLGSLKDIAAMLTDINKNDRHYRVTDMNRYVESIELRCKILHLIIGVYAIFFLVCKTYLFCKTQKINIHNLFPFLVLILLNLSIICTIWHHIRFEIWVPKFSGTLTKQLYEAILNVGLLPSQEYLSAGVLELSRLNLYANVVFLLGLISSLNFIFVQKIENNVVLRACFKNQ